jgi:nucleoside-diphosphate-sugar epimerase
MKILVLGGTRLLGLAVVNRLVSGGHEVTVVSRRSGRMANGARSIVAERSVGLTKIAVHDFDLVIDFLAYTAAHVNEVISVLGNSAYFLISSTWLTRLGAAVEADQLIENPEKEALEKLLPITRQYLLQKNDAEKAVVSSRVLGRKAVILRMPIFWGSNDHTGRIAFYASRLLDRKPIMLVNGGVNLTQIAWVEDIAVALEKSIGLITDGDRCVWECLPHAGVTVKNVIVDIAAGLKQTLDSIDVSEQLMAQVLPSFLEFEPLWRESALKITGSNLFLTSGIAPHAQSDWLPHCAALQDHVLDASLRRSELELIDGMNHA